MRKLRFTITLVAIAFMALFGFTGVAAAGLINVDTGTVNVLSSNDENEVDIIDDSFNSNLDDNNVEVLNNSDPTVNVNVNT